MAHEQTLTRNAMFGAVVVAVIAALVLARSNPAADQRPAPYAQLENKEGLFPPPPALPEDDTRYAYTPSAADGEASAAGAAPSSPNVSPLAGSVEGAGPVGAFGGAAELHAAPPSADSAGGTRADAPATVGSSSGALVPGLYGADPMPAGSVVWVERPSARRISELFPERALREGVGGRVALNCWVYEDLAPRCTVSSESPPGYGFGQAALRAAASYRARPTLSNGHGAVGAETRVIMSFQAP